MKKRVVISSLVMVVVLVLSMLVASCSGENETVTTTATTTNTATATATATATTTTTATETVKPITLTYGSIYSDPHPYYIADMLWIEKVEAESNGRLKIEYYPGSTLVTRNECYAECVAGVCDITYGEVGNQEFGFTLHRLTEPWMYQVTDYMDRYELWLDLVARYPEIADEFNETKMLGMSLGVVYQMVTTQPVRTPADVGGMSFKAMGSYGDWINNMGGEGVPVPMGEAYVSLQKGILDGVLSPYETFKTFSFGEVAPYCTIINVAGTAYPGRVMNLDKYNSLPADLQKILDDNVVWYSEIIGKTIYDRDEEGIAEANKMGVEFIELTPEVRAEFISYLDQVCLDTAAELDELGYPGTEMYAYCVELSKKYQ